MGNANQDHFGQRHSQNPRRSEAMISIGDRLDEKYVVTQRLGGGGFGDVFLANDEAIPNRQVAIKVLSRPRENDQTDLLWEMQTLSQLNHPHVVVFYHHFSDENRLYLVMEFCPDGSLHDRLRAQGGCPEEQVFAWGLELCDTLAFVHEPHSLKPRLDVMIVVFRWWRLCISVKNWPTCAGSIST